MRFSSGLAMPRPRGRPSPSRRGLQRLLALRESRVAQVHAAEVQPHPEARGRRTAGPGSVPRARVRSWPLLVLAETTSGAAGGERGGGGTSDCGAGPVGRTLDDGGRRDETPTPARPGGWARPLLWGRIAHGDRRPGDGRRPAARPSVSAHSCATPCCPSTYWYEELPEPRPCGPSPRPRPTSKLCATGPLDSSFSYITSKASSDAFFSDSQFIGFGVSYRRTSDTELRVAQTFPGGPAAEAGTATGATISSPSTARRWAICLRTGEIATIFGAERGGRRSPT